MYLKQALFFIYHDKPILILSTYHTTVHYPLSPFHKYCIALPNITTVIGNYKRNTLNWGTQHTTFYSQHWPKHLFLPFSLWWLTWHHTTNVSFARVCSLSSLCDFAGIFALTCERHCLAMVFCSFNGLFLVVLLVYWWCTMAKLCGVRDGVIWHILLVLHVWEISVTLLVHLLLHTLTT